MKLFKHLIIIFLALVFIACGNSNSTKEKQFSLTLNTKNNTIPVNETLKITLNNIKKNNVSKVTYKLDGKVITESTNLNNFKLGEHTITATVNFNGETETVTKALTILNDKAPKFFKYEIVNTYPHDATSYTQGLEFHNGILYESTGQYGESKLRKIDYKTGEILKNVDLAKTFFAEGLTILNHNIYQLTWQNKKGFVYDLENFERKNSFSYGKSTQGWGLCNNGTELLKSDGTAKIWTLNTETLSENSYIQAYHNKGKIGRLNELEWVEGKIYANIYERNGVAIINPENGATEAVMDFTALTKEIPNFSINDNVLNGLAYNPETKTLFVTGKRWNKMFEVKIIE